MYFDGILSPSHKSSEILHISLPTQFLGFFLSFSKECLKNQLPTQPSNYDSSSNNNKST